MVALGRILGGILGGIFHLCIYTWIYMHDNNSLKCMYTYKSAPTHIQTKTDEQVSGNNMT